MTTSNHQKMFTQLSAKPAKLKKFIKHNQPKKRTFGQSSKKCKLCGRTHAYVQKYGLDICRQCFRLSAKKMGFKKYM